jgi:hypothetical protein
MKHSSGPRSQHWARDGNTIEIVLKWTGLRKQNGEFRGGGGEKYPGVTVNLQGDGRLELSEKVTGITDSYGSREEGSEENQERLRKKSSTSWMISKLSF